MLAKALKTSLKASLMYLFNLWFTEEYQENSLPYLPRCIPDP